MPGTVESLEGTTVLGLAQRFNDESDRRVAVAVPAWEGLVRYTISIANLLNIGGLTPGQSLAQSIHQFRGQSIIKLATLTDEERALVVPEDDEPFAAVDPTFGLWPA